ncbi:helix-turn-helix domain-containing protein [Nocardioides sp. Kera G14]|uniref:helix-turn-helix domain-containing protein n=1 Tax=Nocardioides sp. Kera G14 TaxID=2884264 RepID=UPI001D127E2E|nr:helix-turn-helix domain-containing protein [Nocardioides sp. Kera G14]UDY25070.1 helix-turn-helix domain-containing protein [Nocardioides sp. Kera G14]
MIEITRNGRLSAAVGTVAGLLALAFLVRAQGAIDLTLGAVLLLIAAAQLWSAWDARLPLLIADAQGVRMRLGRVWAGLPWAELDEIEHLPRASWLRDGKLVLLPRDEDSILAGLSPAGRRQAALGERLYGAPFVLPLGLTTRVSDGGAALSSRLADLSSGVTSIVEIDPSADVPATDSDADDTEMESTAERPALFASRATSPLRSAPVAAVTADGSRDLTREFTTMGANALAADTDANDDANHHLPEAEELQHSFPPFGLEEDGFHEPEVEIDPVIGPVLVTARERLGLSLEQVSERSRIRVRILERIERDDFAACGGDFYARGHLRTLARVLGTDVTPLLEKYDELYADAPVDPRRVFETDTLAGTTGGALRQTRKGPNWSVLVAAVMSVVLLWSIARLVFDGASPEPTGTIGLSSGSAGTSNPYGKLAPAVPVVLNAASGGASVVVRDAGGNVVFSGDLAFGESKTLRVSPPVRIQSSDGSLTVAVDGAKAKAVGETGVAGQRIYAGTHD